MLYMVTFTINIPQMLVYIYIPYMDPMGYNIYIYIIFHFMIDYEKNINIMGLDQTLIIKL
jgi:hypothetical protein